MNTGSAQDCPDRRAAALEYAQMGWALVPLAPRSKQPHSGLLPRDSHTGKPSWRLLAANRPSEREIIEWFRREPEINIGMICGSASGGIVAADFDRPTPEGWHIPVTPRSITRRGEHLFFRSTDPVPGRALLLGGDHIGEVRADNSYVVVPPSLHPTGQPYQWAKLLSPFDLDWTFAEPPGWLVILPKPTQPAFSHPDLQGKQVKNILYSLTHGTAGDELGAWCSSDGFVQAAALLLGIEADKVVGENLGKPFRCILPDHGERRASASLYRRRDGLVVYRDWHRRDGTEFYYLAEVYASGFYGHSCKLSSPELAVWQLRLLVDMGFVAPAYVPMPDLPAFATPAMVRVYDGFKLLLGCKWLHTPGEPTPFSWRFASVWCRVSERHAGAAIGGLIRAGVIRIAGQFTTARQKRLTLFLPGFQSINP